MSAPIDRRLGFGMRIGSPFILSRGFGRQTVCINDKPVAAVRRTTSRGRRAQVISICRGTQDHLAEIALRAAKKRKMAIGVDRLVHHLLPWVVEDHLDVVIDGAAVVKELVAADTIT